MRGTPLRNLTMFQALCGDDALKNVILATTMWDQVQPDVGSKRENQLQTEFWKPMIERGSRVARFNSDFGSAWEIANSFSTNAPRATQLQKELVDEGMVLDQTSAFKAIVRWWEQALTKVKGKINKSRYVTRWRVR